MIEIEKSYSDNPFVDELIYYSKYIALNSVVKDEDEALSYETPKSLRNGDVYIACIEGKAVYEMFESIPKEILEKYIKSSSNIDDYVKSNATLKAYLRNLGQYKEQEIYDNISRLARIIYCDHYNIMKYYIESLGPNWLEDNENLYNACVQNTATYKDLFEIMPEVTRENIVKEYITNFSNIDFSEVCKSLTNFQNYIDSRSDDISENIDKINKAMCSCFRSHYETMVQRKYFVADYKNNWYDYKQSINTYDKCMSNTATYKDLYVLFPKDDLRELLIAVFDNLTVDTYKLDEDIYNLTSYINSGEVEDDTIIILEAAMRSMYIRNYNICLNENVYNRCISLSNDYYELTKYIPKETLKLILNTEIKAITNIDVYSDNKKMLNMYLNTIDPSEAQKIKDNITKDMMSYYIQNYKELNNYYRTLMGLPQLDSKENPYTDTLMATYDANSDSYISFGTKLLDMIPEGIYPEEHWTKTKLCEFDSYDVSILTEYGVFEKFLELCGTTADTKRYRYLNYLGDNKLDVYKCRKALNFQLMSIPTIDNTKISSLYIDKFIINRDYVIRTVYSDAYKFESDYYNKFIIIFIVINTIMDMLTTIPELIINREIFDSRSIKYLFESYGIPYYSEIPTKYQQAMLKNLNTLIKYKSSTRNMIDICSLFGFDDIKVFGYYMLKTKNVDLNTGEYIFEYNNDINYPLSSLYVLDPQGKYKDNSNARYSKITEYSKYVESQYTHKVNIKNDDGTISVKTVINNDIDCYIRDEKNNIFIPLKNTDYFTKVKANTESSDLKFIRVPIGESITEYKNDGDYISQYDEIVEGDDTWDGGLLHEKIKQDIINYEFNDVITKYISIETVTQLSEMAFQVSYFYNMLFDNYYSEEALTIEIPYIKQGHKFRFMDVVCYLFSLMYIYHGLEDTIMYSPTQILYVKGYNFNSDLNTVLQDPNIFTQTDNPMDQENIFNINDRIIQDDYNYQKAFEDHRLNITSFNLQADIDALDTWLKDNYQLTLDDFVVDDTLTKFDHVITLRDFYSLNNSYYRKELGKDTIKPTEYNQDIKYAYSSRIVKKFYYIGPHNTIEFIRDGIINPDGSYTNPSVDLIINSNENCIYIPDTKSFCEKYDGNADEIYYKYIKNDNGEYYEGSVLPYYRTGEEYNLILDKNILIKDSLGRYILSSDEYYKKDKFTNNNYELITDNKYFYTDKNGIKIINVGDYYVRNENDELILNPDNCYVIKTQGGKDEFILAKDINKYARVEIPIEECYILHDDGHFICLKDTDFYRKNEDGTYSYNEEECFIKWNTITQYFDPEYPNVYYMKISDYHNLVDTNIDDDTFYVKDSDGNYIPEKNIIDVSNCYILDKENYVNISLRFIKYSEYRNAIIPDYTLILQPNNDYFRYNHKSTTYTLDQDPNIRYVLNSQLEYLTILYTDKVYASTKEMIVILNKEVAGITDTDLYEYNPEDDSKWDENDWFYYDNTYDESNKIGMNGENKWYYRRPGDTTTIDENNVEKNISIGSGFYISADSFIGDYELEPGAKYYLSMDVETNFESYIQIACEADTNLEDVDSKNYHTLAWNPIHIGQVFIANQNTKPRVRVYIYNYKDYPIKPGDYIIIRNINLVRAYNNNYIPKDIPSYDKLQLIYRTNEAIYKYLANLMVNCSDFKTYQIYKKLFDSLMISKYNKEAFKLSSGKYATTYTEFLQTRDSVLFERLTYFRSLNEETMHKEVANNIIEVTYAIDDCVDTYSYAYLYSYFPAVSATYIQQYISKIINFFKSWKVHLLGINTVYRFDDKMENTIKVLEDQIYKIKLKPSNHVFIDDSVKINPIDDTDSAGHKYIDKYSDLTQYSHEYSDSVVVKDRVKIIRSYDSDDLKSNLSITKDGCDTNSINGLEE